MTGPVEPSDELIRLTKRYYEAIRTADLATFSNLQSEDVCFREFGTDGSEFWKSKQISVGIATKQFQEGGAGDLRPLSVEAWSDGTMGWSVGVIEQPSSPQVGLMRASMVFRLEAGQWKVVHVHSSFGVSNEESVGHKLTTTLDEIADLASGGRPDLASVASPEGTVTIVFTDIERSTVTAELLGDDDWLDLLRWHNGIIESQTYRFEGTVVKSQGDGYMLAFSSASRALDFAASAQHLMTAGFVGQEVRIRIGINAGDAIRYGDDFFGHAVIVASRVATSAAGGQILVTQLVADLVAGSTRFRFGDELVVELRGLPGTYRMRPLLLQDA